MRVSQRILATDPPVIAALADAAALLRAAGRDLVDLGQGVPNLVPGQECRVALGSYLAEPAIHRYSPDAGLPELRAAVADEVERRSGVEVDPRREVLVTAGANHAFVQVLLTCLDAGDGLVVPSPWYFNHVMACQLAGVSVLDWPMRVQGDRYRLDAGGLEPLLARRPRALVCVNPNNPTGAVLPDEEIAFLVSQCVRADITLIYDEVYHALVFDAPPTLHPWRLPGGREHTIVIGSFSKQFGLTGWRVGYCLAPPAVIQEMLKVQDTTVICAPVAGQRLALECLRRCPDLATAYRRDLGARSEQLRGLLERVPGVAWRRPEGAIFGMLAYPGTRASTEVATQLLAQEGVITVPGAAFGPAGEGHLRLSFGNLSEDDLTVAVSRLARFF